MTVFDQMGDPVCPPCLCQHHEAVYAEHAPPGGTNYPATLSELVDPGTVIIQVDITTTERCCIVVNAATMAHSAVPPDLFEIERPLGTPRTTQADEITSTDIRLMHHAAWEVLPAGTHTYFLVYHGPFAITVYGTWIKAVASDCEG